MRVIRRWAIILCVVFVAMTIAFWPRLPKAVRVALEQADTFELYALDPDRPEQKQPDDFDGRHVVGHVSILDGAIRRELIDALAAGVLSPLAPTNLCFNPRHAIRVTQGGTTTDFLICFECRQATGGGGWTTDASPQPTFDRVLRAAGVTPSTKP